MLKKITVVIATLFLAFLHAEENQTSSKVETKTKPSKPLVCAPCDEPLPGTALWHYMKGIEELIGVKTNPYLANEHFKRAVDMNYPPAIKALADSYYAGDGIDQDRKQALVLYIRAADLGDGAAQFNAGVIFLRGYAGEIDYVLAYYYLCLATMNEGLDEMAQDAAIYRDEAATNLSSEQLQDIYRKLINNPALNPSKSFTKPDLTPSLKSVDQHPEKPLRLANGNQEPS